MQSRILSDVCKMAENGALNVDLFQRRAKLFAQAAGIAIGSVRGAEAGHCNTVDSFSVKAADVKGARGSKQGQRGIESAG